MGEQQCLDLMCETRNILHDEKGSKIGWKENYCLPILHVLSLLGIQNTSCETRVQEEQGMVQVQQADCSSRGFAWAYTGTLSLSSICLLMMVVLPIMI